MSSGEHFSGGIRHSLPLITCSGWVHSGVRGVVQSLSYSPDDLKLCIPLSDYANRETMHNPHKRHKWNTTGLFIAAPARMLPVGGLLQKCHACLPIYSQMIWWWKPRSLEVGQQICPTPSEQKRTTERLSGFRRWFRMTKIMQISEKTNIYHYITIWYYE